MTISIVRFEFRILTSELILTSIPCLFQALRRGNENYIVIHLAIEIRINDTFRLSESQL